MDSIFQHHKPTKHSDEKTDKHHSHSSSDSKPDKNDQPSRAELLSSAKLVADAAKSKLNHDSEKVDKTKVAHAAGDLLNAASHYGKLDEKTYGKYVGKAENYLHNYNSNPTKPSSQHSDHSGDSAKPSKQSGSGHSDHSGASAKPSKHSGGGTDYLKKAEGFLRKH